MARRTAPHAAAPAAPAAPAPPEPAPAAPADGVMLIGDVAVPLARVWVEVVVSHDGMLAGRIVELAFTERTQNLINSGYLDLVAPPAGVEL